jgi:O-antigen/teichoic acid export membrane protein
MSETHIKNTSLKTQSAWLLFAKTVGFAFAFVLPLLVTRYLSQEKVGVYRQVFLVVTNAAAILPLGFSMSAYYFLARETERRKAAVFNILLFNFVMGALAFAALFFYPQILGGVFKNEETTRLAPLVGATVWLWIFSSFLETVAVANREPRLATAFIILAQLTKTVLMSAAVVAFSTVDAFLYAAIFQAVLQIAALMVYLAKRFPGFWASFDFRFFREQFSYALPFGLVALLWTVQTDVHNYFVGYRFSAAEFAIYAYGCFQLPLIAMIRESVTSVLIPRMSELERRGDTGEIVRLTARAMEKLAFFNFPIYLFLLITAQTFVVTLFTENFAASVPIFLINLTLLPFDILIIDPIVRAFRQFSRFVLTLRIFVLILMIAALVFGVQHFDLRGMIAIVVVAVLFERFVMTAFIVRKLRLERKDLKLFRGILKTAFASLAAGAALFVFYHFTREFLLAFLTGAAENFLSVFALANLARFAGGCLFLGVCFLIFSSVYLPAANFFGLIEPDEKQKVKSLWNKFFGRKPKAVETFKF